VVVKDTVLKEMPWIAGELCQAFEKSKTEYLKNLDLGDAATSWDRAAKVNAEAVGDPFPFGIEPNRTALEAMTQFAVDQKMVPRKFAVDELFAPIQ
jgi:4,5-dihydroxyphthalate decarboxylase